MIQVENLTKYYGEYAAIENVSFAVEKGEILGFLGPNAAGKTTTSGSHRLLQPTSGKAPWPVSTWSRSRLKRASARTARERPLRRYVAPQLPAGARLKGRIAQVNKRVEEVMEHAHHGPRRSVISKLSKGYRQRVGLAQALIQSDVLVPTSHRRPRPEPDREIPSSSGPRRDRTIILSTHILREVEMLCGRIVIIHEGKVAAMDTPDNLALRLRRAQQIGVHVRGPEREVQAKLAALPGVLRVQVVRAGDSVVELLVDGEEKHDVREALASAIVGNGWGLRHMAEVGMSLEEIFRQLTAEEKGVAA